MKKSFAAHGKLLLTGEYLVMDGAQALALPVKLGQSLTVIPDPALENKLHWQSLDREGNCWFEAVFNSTSLACLHSTDEKVADRLQQILLTAKDLQPGLPFESLKFTTSLAFPREWGLGTSSTLIYLLAQWAQVDAFEMQFRTFGGSGYDIACAGADGPVLYWLDNGRPSVETCFFKPPFSQLMFFVYLGKKQDSRAGIAQYRASSPTADLQSALSRMTQLTQRFIQSNTLEDFEKNIVEHENLLAEILGLKRAKDLYFNDFWGEIKSLGAWGGDFVLATSNRPVEETRRFFNEKGFSVFLPYNELVLYQY